VGKHSCTITTTKPNELVAPNLGFIDFSTANL